VRQHRRFRNMWRLLRGDRIFVTHTEQFDEQADRDRDRPGKNEQGQAMIEVALALPVIAAFTLMLIEICLAFYSYCMISETAREGTRYAIVRGATCQTSSGASCTASASTINSVVSHLGWPNLGSGTLSANTTYPDGNENQGSRVQVVVSFTFPYNIPFAPKGTLQMSSTSVMYIVQ
jgi:Flp pilus assembly protein TadG